MMSQNLQVADFTSKLVMLEQGSDAWLAWRKGGAPGSKDEWSITATDAPVILGKSKFATPDLLWRRKLGLAPAQFVSAAMKRGNMLEPQARASYEETYGDIYTPVCVEVAEAPWLKASLDGLSFDGDEILEIKCPNEVTHAMALEGNVPLMYWIQIQHQLMCSKAKRCWYYSFDGMKGAPRIEVLPDPVFQQQMLEAEIFFRQCLFDQKHPEGEDWVAAASRYILLKAEMEDAQEALKGLEGELVTMLGEEKTRQGGGVKVTRSVIAGRVDYQGFLCAKIGEPEISNLDLLATYAARHHIDLTQAENLPEFRKIDYQAYLCKQLGVETISADELLASYAEQHSVDLGVAAETPEFCSPDSVRLRITVAKDVDLDAIKVDLDSNIQVETANAVATADTSGVGIFAFI